MTEHIEHLYTMKTAGYHELGTKNVKFCIVDAPWKSYLSDRTDIQIMFLQHWYYASIKQQQQRNKENIQTILNHYYLHQYIIYINNYHVNKKNSIILFLQ